MHRFLAIVMIVYGLVGAAAWAFAWFGLMGEPRSPLSSLFGIYIGLPWTALAGGISAPENDVSNLSGMAGGILINLVLLERLRRRSFYPRRW